MRRAIVLHALLCWPASSLGQSVYFGNLHAHTSYSDGSGTPDEAYARARGNGLHFFAITEHNHPAGDGSGERRDGRLIGRDPQLYRGQNSSLVETADRHNRNGTFVALYGQEVSTISQGNHINVFGASSVLDVANVPNGDVQALLNWVSSHRDASGRALVLQFNHPRDPDRNLTDYGRDDFPESQWVSSLDPFVELIEVLNAPALKKGENFRAEAKEGYYLEYLNLGFHVGPSVGHDNHWKNWGTSTDARIGVVASALTREAIMAALRQRRTFASEDRNLQVIFRSGNAIGGDILSPPAPGTPLPLTLQLTDPDEPNARYRIDVLTDHPGGDKARRPVESFIIQGNTAGRVPLEGIIATAAGQFVLLRITQSSSGEGDDEHQEVEDRVWTAPIWFEAGAAPARSPSQLRIAELLPNPTGDEFINESITITNGGSAVQDLTGWQLRDASGNTWSLTGSIGAAQSRRVTRGGQPMSMNNGGDVIELLQPDGTVADTVSYERAAEGQTIRPAVEQ